MGIPRRLVSAKPWSPGAYQNWTVIKVLISSYNSVKMEELLSSPRFAVAGGGGEQRLLKFRKNWPHCLPVSLSLSVVLQLWLILDLHDLFTLKAHHHSSIENRALENQRIRFWM
ncbi:hypothetical protein Bca4012_069180 [Brassica carinata]